MEDNILLPNVKAVRQAVEDTSVGVDEGRAHPLSGEFARLLDGVWFVRYLQSRISF